MNNNVFKQMNIFFSIVDFFSPSNTLLELNFSYFRAILSCIMLQRKIMISIAKGNICRFSTGSVIHALHDSQMNTVKKESEKMKRFREKLKTEAPHNLERLNDPVLIDINPDNGEFIPESEKEPTKWGDWQHGGRVSDF